MKRLFHKEGSKHIKMLLSRMPRSDQNQRQHANVINQMVGVSKISFCFLFLKKPPSLFSDALNDHL